MTFYQELQLNQAGSKNLLKKSETVKEKSYHILVYLVKIAVTMAFCFSFVTIFFMMLFDSPIFIRTISHFKFQCAAFEQFFCRKLERVQLLAV